MPDWSWNGSLKGAGTGALTGFIASGGNPYGALAGGGIGFVGGGLSGGAQEKADRIRQQGAQQGLAGLEGLGSDMSDRRAIERNRTMDFYGPAMDVMEEFYGVPKSSWGDGVPANYRNALQNLQSMPRKPAFQNLSGFGPSPAPPPPPMPAPAPPPMPSPVRAQTTPVTGGASRGPGPWPTAPVAGRRR